MVKEVPYKIQDNSVFFEIDIRIYPLSSIYSAGYVFLDKCHIILDRLEESIVQVELNVSDSTPENLEVLRKDFYDELLKVSFHTKLSESTSAVHSQIVQSALSPATKVETDSDKELLKELEDIEKLDFEDSEDIAVPWEEKYGDKSSEK